MIRVDRGFLNPYSPLLRLDKNSENSFPYNVCRFPKEDCCLKSLLVSATCIWKQQFIYVVLTNSVPTSQKAMRLHNKAQSKCWLRKWLMFISYRSEKCYERKLWERVTFYIHHYFPSSLLVWRQLNWRQHWHRNYAMRTFPTLFSSAKDFFIPIVCISISTLPYFLCLYFVAHMGCNSCISFNYTNNFNISLLNIYYFTSICTNKYYKINTEFTPTCFGVNTPSSGSLQIVRAELWVMK